MGLPRHFADEMWKVALSIKAPKIPLSIAGVTTSTGNNVIANATTRALPSAKPAISSARNIGSKGAKSVALASGGNLGSKVIPKRKTVPPVGAGGSLIR